MLELISEDDVRKKYARESIEYIKFNLSEKKDVCLDTLSDTKERRKSQICKTYEIKIDKSHLNRDTFHQLNMMFLEEKWFCNYIVSQNNVYDVDYKIDKVPVKVRDTFEEREIKYLSAQMKQETVNRIKDNITGLSETKKEGRKIGRLKPKSRERSIPLVQYGATYKILDNKYIKIQGVEQKIRVNGLEQILDQIEDGIEVTNANLIKRHGDFYIHIVTYIKKEEKVIPEKHTGIDLGIARQLVFSNGVKVEYSIPITKKIRKLYQKMGRQKLHSKNWYKTMDKLIKEFEKLINIKGDIKNKIIHFLSENYSVVSYQDENIKAWQRIWGKKVLSTAIGGIIDMTQKKIHTPVEIDKFFPSTKKCCKCGHEYDIRLDERVYSCKNEKCRNVMDRDWNSATNIDNEGLKQLEMRTKSVGTGHIEFRPGEILISTLMLEYLNNIPYVKASLT